MKLNFKVDHHKDRQVVLILVYNLTLVSVLVSVCSLPLSPEFHPLSLRKYVCISGLFRLIFCRSFNRFSVHQAVASDCRWISTTRLEGKYLLSFRHPKQAIFIPFSLPNGQASSTSSCPRPGWCFVFLCEPRCRKTTDGTLFFNPSPCQGGGKCPQIAC